MFAPSHTTNRRSLASPLPFASSVPRASVSSPRARATPPTRRPRLPRRLPDDERVVEDERDALDAVIPRATDDAAVIARDDARRDVAERARGGLNPKPYTRHPTPDTWAGRDACVPPLPLASHDSSRTIPRTGRVRARSVEVPSPMYRRHESDRDPRPRRDATRTSRPTRESADGDGDATNETRRDETKRTTASRRDERERSIRFDSIRFDSI